MKITRQKLEDKAQTGVEMKRLVLKYADDLDRIMVSRRGEIKKLTDFTLSEFFDFVRKIPYAIDNKPIEVVARPLILIKNRDSGLDCKKKAILMGAYFAKKKIWPWRFIASSRRLDGKIHHVFPQIYIAGKWKNTDATYSDYQLYQPKPDCTKAEIL